MAEIRQSAVDPAVRMALTYFFMVSGPEIICFEDSDAPFSGFPSSYDFRLRKSPAHIIILLTGRGMSSVFCKISWYFLVG